MAAPDKLTELEMILKKFIREQNEQNRHANFFMQEQSTTQAKLVEDVEEIKRGLYGDPKNEVVGIMTTVKMLKTFKTRAVYWGSGLVVGVNGAIYFVKHLFDK
jgi:hypothetical protein